MNRETHYDLEEFLKKRNGKRKPERPAGMPKSYYFPTLKGEKRNSRQRSENSSD